MRQKNLQRSIYVLKELENKYNLKSKSKPNSSSKKLSFLEILKKILLIFLSLSSFIILIFYVSTLGQWHIQITFKNSDDIPIFSWRNSDGFTQNRATNLTLPKGVEEISCHLPKLNPFDESILEYIKERPPVNCDGNPNNTVYPYPKLFYTDYTTNKLWKVKKFKKYNFEKCCYKNLTRTSESGMKFSKKCYSVKKNGTEIPTEHDFIAVYCQPKENKTQILLDMFNFISLKNLKSPTNKEFKETDLNIIMLGIDATSHMNFIRMFPKTRNFVLNELNGDFMGGYTKVGSNTFPNLVSVLMGKAVAEIKTGCWIKEKYFDDCPFIWKKYSEKGYVTAYAEDTVHIGTFNYCKSGFLKQPVDYYLDSFMWNFGRKLGHDGYGKGRYCYGSSLVLEVLFNHLKKIANTMGSSRRYFSFTWSTALSHDSMNVPRIGDQPMASLLGYLKEHNFLNNSALFLLSDHGIGFGPIRSTYQGRIEDSMPLLYAVFPQWFKNKYRSALSNFKQNKNRLTSPFDLHETLNDLLDVENISNERIKERHSNNLKILNSGQNLTRGQSLFLPIPLNRSCANAGIPEQFCVCHSLSKIDLNDTKLLLISKSAIEFINTLLKNYRQCAQLRLKGIKNAQVMEKEVTIGKNKESSPRAYVVQFETSPSGARFEATMKPKKRNKEIVWEVDGEISRINMYGNQSYCIAEFNLKKYCYCS